MPSNRSSIDWDELANTVCSRLATNKRVRRTLPHQGRIRIDRQLPFLCVYRQPHTVDHGTKDLVTSEASYLHVSGEHCDHNSVSQLCKRVAEAMQEHFGTFLLIEIWSSSKLDQKTDCLTPAFEIVAEQVSSIPTTIEKFSSALRGVVVGGRSASVSVRETERVGPPTLAPIRLATNEKSENGCVILGLAVRPIYQDSVSGVLFPMVLKSLRSQVAWSLRQAISIFNGSRTKLLFPHFHSFGPTSFVKAARIVDQELSEVSESFDFILQVTPTNTEEAWRDFRECGFQRKPALFYRPLPYDPSVLKRRLFAIEIERIEDASLGDLLWHKQSELDQQITALRLLDTKDFCYSSLQLYGAPGVKLVKLAERILLDNPAERSHEHRHECATVEEVVDLAREELDYYHQKQSEFNGSVEVSDDIASGFLASRGRLLVSRNLRIARKRVKSLLHHEIGTHLLTYFNGRCQPFRQLYAGLEGYEGLQEGLAVMAEYLTGGLTVNRMRTLAGRVVAANSMIKGDSFPETFRLLHEKFGISRHRAFIITLRVFRGGGLTKDIIYLRGLHELLEYLRGGHDLEPLYVGKIGLHHLPQIQEMRRRGIIQAPSVLPRFWNDSKVRDRLQACRKFSVADLLGKRK